MAEQDPFYVGWQARAPARYGHFARAAVRWLLAGAVVVAAMLALLQRPFAPAAFEYGTVRSFEGVVRLAPAPHLAVDVPAASERAALLLVAPFKHGAEALVADFDGRRVRLDGTLIHRGEATMVEVVPGSLQALDEDGPPAPAPVSHGVHELRGEIVDSKCWLGVMKPGEGKPHRACASLCIRGGIPPVLVVRAGDGRAETVLLVGPGGRAVNEDVLPFVAEPVAVQGELRRSGALWVLEADPASIRRIL